ncbi:MAG: 16S rRNA (cytosine(1402)-N(4))-methyltransferase RsmH [Leptospira sp.]|nr:16S rRNA (cytosine(1402)-N(4))-methyltransferase RsmH [Leptospira sp.]
MPDEEFHITHYPVMVREVLDTYLLNWSPESKLRFIDGTGGEGGHVEAVLKEFPNSEVLFLDRDSEMIERAETRLNHDPRAHSLELNFSDLTRHHLSELGWNDGVDGILLDLGISIYHITDSGRGFSFRGTEDLDMRLSRDIRGRSISAFDVINTYPSKEIERIFYEYGEERWTKKIVERIVERRRTNPIRTNSELAKLVESSIPRKFWPPKNHPSLRVFQALRIEVNQELFHLKKAITDLPFLLKPGGIMQVISFHSLEDRIVKHGFRELVQQNDFTHLDKKPRLPSEEEIKTNPPSRSAKLRSLKKIELSDD